MVYQILDRKPDSKILIASQSHVAVDHSLTKIKESMPNVQLIRIGIKENYLTPLLIIPWMHLEEIGSKM